MPAVGLRRNQGHISDQVYMAKPTNLDSENPQKYSGLKSVTGFTTSDSSKTGDLPGKAAIMGSFKTVPTNNPVRFPVVSADDRFASKNHSEGVPSRPHPKSPLLTLLKKGQAKPGDVSRLLVTVNVLGSAGPLRFLARSDDTVQKIMESALKSYAREGRLPVLGHCIKQFELYCANGGYEALEPSEVVGLLGTRNFLLCRKQQSKIEEEKELTGSNNHGKNGLFKSLFNTMSMGFGVSSH